MAAAQAAPARRGWRAGILGEMSAEFLGTFVLLALGIGCVAMTVVALPGSGRTASPTTIFQGPGDWLVIVFGWAFAVAFGVYIAGGITGAHLNPAVTLAFALKRDFPWRKVLPYMLAQLLGAFCAAFLDYVVYHQAISAFEKADHITRGAAASNTTFSIFATFPAGYFHGYGGPLIDQIVGTAFLVMFVFALTDLFNQPPRANLTPLLVGFVVAAIGLSYGANAGYAINPARDLGPRIFAAIAGWGAVAFPGTVHGGGLNFTSYFWVPIVGPFIGGPLGAYVYDLLIRDVLTARGTEPQEDVEAEGVTDIERDREHVESQGRTDVERADQGRAERESRSVRDEGTH